MDSSGCAKPPEKRTVGLQVSALLTVALATEQLQILNGGRAAQGHRDQVIVLKIEIAAALNALAAVSLEDCSADFTRNGLTLSAWSLLSAFVNIKQHARPVQSLRGSPLAVSDQRQHVPIRVAARLPVEGIFEPPPDSGARPDDGHWLLSLADANWLCRDTSTRTGGQHVPTNQTRLRNRKPRS
jgi:hypothetical protein